MNGKIKTILLAALCFTFTAILHAQTTTFTYQGRLNDGGAPANGTNYSMVFYVYDTSANGSPLGNFGIAHVTVSNGLFTVPLDFGNVFDGNPRWLEVSVEKTGPGGDSGFTTLTPRQQILSTPYAIMANSASNLLGTLPSMQLTGTLSNAVLPASPNFSGAVTAASFFGNGANVTNVNAAALSGLNAANFWQLGGNYAAPGQFIGSTNNQPMEIWTGGQRSMRFEPNTNGAPNVIGGAPVNYVSNGVVGATIAGGGAANYFGSSDSNTVSGNFGTVSGGRQNIASEYYATVGGGWINAASGSSSTVGGGEHNAAGSMDATIGGGAANTAIGQSSTVGGGTANIANDLYTTVGGGLGNSTSFKAATVAGGFQNSASNFDATVSGGNQNTASGAHATVGGGYVNIASDFAATVAGGQQNKASANAGAVGGGALNTASGNWATVGGGDRNMASGQYATVPGGFQNIASGNYTFAAGSNAQATNDSAFVWSDGSVATTSTTNDQFVARASGGFVFYSSTNISAGVALAPGSGSWSSLSDRDAKNNFAPLDSQSVLARVVALPLATWSYKTESGVRHIGPMAQDFYAAFEVGEDNRHIADVDEGGVALAAVQGLNQKLTGELKRRDAENAELKRQLNQLTKMVHELNQKLNGDAR